MFLYVFKLLQPWKNKNTYCIFFHPSYRFHLRHHHGFDLSTRIWAPLVSGESQICHSSVSETTICWGQVESHPWVSPHDWQGRWSPQKFWSFRQKKTSRTNSSQSVFYFQANCHCHRMANLSSQIKLNTQLDTVCLSLNQFFAAKALHAGWRLCNGVHTMRPWYHGRLTLKDCHGIEGISVSLQLLHHSVSPNWTTLQPLESSKMDQSMDDFSSSESLLQTLLPMASSF